MKELKQIMTEDTEVFYEEFETKKGYYIVYKTPEGIEEFELVI